MVDKHPAHLQMPTQSQESFGSLNYSKQTEKSLNHILLLLCQVELALSSVRFEANQRLLLHISRKFPAYEVTANHKTSQFGGSQTLIATKKSLI
jgi:hypothetical protein